MRTRRFHRVFKVINVRVAKLRGDRENHPRMRILMNEQRRRAAQISVACIVIQSRLHAYHERGVIGCVGEPMASR